MPVRGHSLASFVPALLARRAPAWAQTGQPPASEVADVAVLGLDISESTAMTEQLAKQDPDGPERVAGILNTVFAMIGDEIVAHGGSVVTLAGDEIVAVWPADDHGGLAVAASLAVTAATATQERTRTLPPVGGHAIRTRAGVGAGRAYLLDIGGEHGRRLFLAAGPAFVEMGAAQHGVAPSQVGVGPTAAVLLAAEPHAAGARPAEPHTAASTVPDALAARYLPASVFHGLRSSGRLRAELSPVTVAFVTLRTGPWGPETSVDVSQASLEVLRRLAAYEGALVSARQDVDGVTLLAGFGLPPVVREHEAARATMCALEIAGALKGYVEHGIGIATGHAFCGVFGSEAYRQYTVVGPIVNLGARLMQRAQNEVLCDEVTQRLGRERLRFSARGGAHVKGIRGAVAVYRPEWREHDPGKRLAERSGGVPTRGRDGERRELAGRLAALSLGTSSGVVVEGDPGAGKTHLAMDLLKASEGYGQIATLVGSGDEMDRRPYHPWKPVLTRALGLSGVRSPAERATAVQRRLDRWPELRDWTPLLSDVLDLGLDGGALREMTGSARRENTTRLLVELLADATGDAPVLLVLDDCHWMDSASWELVRAVHREVHPLMLALFTRPLQAAGGQAQDSSVEVARDLRERGALWLRLAPLEPDTTEQIARDVLAVDSLDPALRALFRERVGGSPLFAVELAFQLRADEVIAVDGDGTGSHGHLAVPAEELGRLLLPVRVDEVFRARLSTLTERQRAVIRAASVVGSRFDAERVHASDPELDEATVEAELLTLERVKIVERDGDGWRFQHTLARDVALHSSLPSELRRRHRCLAEWYERHRLEPGSYATLARHWGAAAEPDRQVDYLEAAATGALVRGAEEEAVSLAREALAADGARRAGGSGAGAARRAFWHSQVGEALTGRGQLDDATGSFAEALRLLGHRVPGSALGWVVRLLREVLVQLMHLLPGVEARLRGRGDRQLTAQAAGVWGLLAETQYFRSDSVAWTAANLAAVNLAEKAGDVGLAGRAYSGLGNLAGTLRAHRLARRYFRRSRRDVAAPHYGTTCELTLAVLPDATWEHDITATLSEAVYLRTSARATDVLPMFDDVVSRLRDAGLNQPLEIALAIRGFMHGVTGTLRPARADFEELLASARRRSNREHVTWALTLLVPLLLALGRPHEAARLDDEAGEVFAEDDRLSLPNYHGSHVAALVARGLLDEAREHAQRAAPALSGTPIFFHLAGLTAMVEACLHLLAARGAAGTRADLRLARRSLRALRRYVRLYPFARARYELHAGIYLALRGRQRAARRRWARGLRLAEDTGLLLDAARIRRRLAAALPDHEPERAEHLRVARNLLDELGLETVEDLRPAP